MRPNCLLKLGKKHRSNSIPFGLATVPAIQPWRACKPCAALRRHLHVCRLSGRQYWRCPATDTSETSLESYLSSAIEHEDGLARVLAAFQEAAQKIATSISRAGFEANFGAGQSFDNPRPANGRDSPKKLDIVANEIIKDAFAECDEIAVAASEEDEVEMRINSSASAQFVAVFDPLDGSSNIDACIPTGTILGIYKCTDEACSPLCAGKELIAAAYVLYSSATMLVLTVGRGVVGFTLDAQQKNFLLTHEIRIPARGQMYSLNDARQFDWPLGLQRYIDNIRQGRGQTGKQYSARYICSLVADFHRTLLYGGWAGNPRSHLRLVYEANPLSFLVEQAGGRGSNGRERVLDIQPESLHQRLPLFLGSPEDIAELESYKDVQQLGSKKYSV